ncbi:MAG: DUF368 domain-containing protein, partial [Planctomycetales bacterium]|nr:DUF368 domain-containing protein [Planctomycetales bacterium]
MTQRRQGIANDLLQVGRGILMGGADVIPGVSGGTVALIVGIYERLITAISHIDIQLLRMLRRGELRAAAEHLDLRFLIALGLGIASGIVALGSIMEKLLTGPQTRGYTLAAFFGMILGSTWIVYQMLDVRTSRRRWEAVLMALLGGAFAYWLTGL